MRVIWAGEPAGVDGRGSRASACSRSRRVAFGQDAASRADASNPSGKSMRGIDPLLRLLAPSPRAHFCRLGTHSRNRFCTTMTAEPEPVQITIPQGYTLHTENTTRILLPPENQAFLNPVQEFNRDLSVACIRTWTELVNGEKEAKWRRNQEKRAKQAERKPKAKRAKSEHIAYPAQPRVLNRCRSEDPSAATPAQADEGVPEPAVTAEEVKESIPAEPAAGPSTKKQPEVCIKSAGY